MSVEAFSWALTVPIGGNAKVVLLGLANHAHPDGREAYPALDTLARYAHCDRSTAKRNVRKLADAGWIERDGHGPRGEAKYRLAMGEPFGGVQNAPGGSSAHEGGAPVPPEPSIEPSSPSLDQDGESRNGVRTSPLDATAAEPPAREGAGARGLNFRGKRVPHDVAAAATLALDAFNTRTGQALQPLKGSGKPSDALLRILGAMTDYPETVTLWPRMLDVALSRPWWDGAPSTGVIFGPKVVENVIQQAQRPALAIAASAPRRGGDGWTAQDMLRLAGAS